MGEWHSTEGIRKPAGRSHEVATAADLFDTIKILFRSDTDSLSRRFCRALIAQETFTYDVHTAEGEGR